MRTQILLPLLLMTLRKIFHPSKYPVNAQYTMEEKFSIPCTLFRWSKCFYFYSLTAIFIIKCKKKEIVQVNSHCSAVSAATCKQTSIFVDVVLRDWYHDKKSNVKSRQITFTASLAKYSFGPKSCEIVENQVHFFIKGH